MKKLTLVIDFDGTIVIDRYPLVGSLRVDAKKYINKLYKQGHTILINTCRTGYYEGEAQRVLKAEGILHDYINCNSPESIKQYGADCRKLSGDMYIDDKNIGGIPLWKEIYRLIQVKAYSNEA